MIRRIAILLFIALIPSFFYITGCNKSQNCEKKEIIKTNPFKGSKEVVKEGETVFVNHCEVCHGVGGMGDVCPDLTDNKWIYGSTYSDLFTSVSCGRQNGMPKWGDFLIEEKIWQVITYIRSLKK